MYSGYLASVNDRSMSRIARVTFCLEPDEKARLRRDAEVLGLDVSGYLRMLVRQRRLANERASQESAKDL